MRNCFLFLFCFALVSCNQDKTVVIPDSVLSEEKMAAVLVDVHLLEATLNIGSFSKDNITKDAMAPKTDILKKHSLTKEQYDESFTFYARNPQLLTEVYLKVLSELSKMQSQVVNSKEK